MSIGAVDDEELDVSDEVEIMAIEEVTPSEIVESEPKDETPEA